MLAPAAHASILPRALTLTLEDGGVSADLPPGLSNAPRAGAAEAGAPFGGLMAALSLLSARELLAIRSPLRTITVQFMAGARFAPCRFTAELLRGGGSTAFAAVRAGQGERTAISSLLTFGREADQVELEPLHRHPPPLAEAAEDDKDHPFWPWFTNEVEHRFLDGPGLFGQFEKPLVRCWMRTRDGLPLDEARLAFLLDAVFPNYWTALPAPPALSATVDLRYDLLVPITEETAPDGFAYFEFQTAHVSGGWAVEDGVCWARDGTPLAVARQRRKLVALRR
ncbi:thioesterase family protein [Brevundimonas sp. 2R-24]|uniref:Thioesterase family protein n=1 Tax=Peiella sedimenti TaxID=3061083 RepID=A0ABT8SGV8_9CAUL|nr:thioesterase family protein [Caulobacteraceae bacterium XZ-24]